VITDPDIERYAELHTTPQADHLATTADDTRQQLANRAGMMVGPLEGGFLAALVAISGARTILEVGTFTGYSAITMAAALPPDGRIVTCEVSEEHAAIAQRHIDASPYADRIEIRLGPAVNTIAELAGPFDMVFIDADKSSYDAYYEATLPKLSEGGFIVFDNVLWSGRVLSDEPADADTAALRVLNDKLRDDARVDVVLLPIRDGVSIARPRAAEGRPRAAEDRPRAAEDRPRAAEDRPGAAEDRPGAAATTPGARAPRPQ
jgi:caffeoyl-CoA O-methyltransferase